MNRDLSASLYPTHTLRPAPNCQIPCSRSRCGFLLACIIVDRTITLRMSKLGQLFRQEWTCFVAIQPPLRLELLRIFHQFRVRGDVGVVDDEVCSFGEEVALKLHILRQLMLRCPDENPPPSEYLLHAGVEIWCRILICERRKPFGVAATDSVQFCSCLEELVSMCHCCQDEHVHRQTGGVAAGLGNLHCQKHLVRVRAREFALSQNNIPCK